MQLEEYYLALHLAIIGHDITKHKLLKKAGEIENVFSPAFLKNFKLPPAFKNSLLKPDWKKISANLNWANGSDKHILFFNTKNYPKRLAEIPDPPLVLFVKGNIKNINKPALAIVGARKSTDAGNETAFLFAKEMANAGLVINSGLAFGIDTCAHKGALAAGGVTYASLGHGFNYLYPARNKNLSEEILVNGGLISEYALDTQALSSLFPRRNRIITGLSLGVLVVEAKKQSGSLISAKFALEQNREVFAIPSSIRNPMASGCHKLIKNGAKLVESPKDIYDELVSFAQLQLTQVETPKCKKRAKKLNKDLILEFIDYTATSFDTICEKSGLKAADLAVKLLDLELQGLILTVPGGYVKNL